MSDKSRKERMWAWIEDAGPPIVFVVMTLALAAFTHSILAP